MKNFVLFSLLCLSACSQKDQTNQGQIPITNFVEVPVNAMGAHTDATRQIKSLVELPDGEVAAWEVTNALIGPNPVAVAEAAKAKLYYFDQKRNELSSQSVAAKGAFISELISAPDNKHVALALEGELEKTGHLAYRAEKLSLVIERRNAVLAPDAVNVFRTRSPQASPHSGAPDEAIKQFQWRTKIASAFEGFGWSRSGLTFTVDPLLGGNGVKFVFGHGEGDNLVAKPLSREYNYSSSCFDTEGVLLDTRIASKLTANKNKRDHEILTMAGNEVTGFVPFHRGEWGEENFDDMFHCVISEAKSGLGQTSFLFGKRSINKGTRTSFLIVNETKFNPLASQTKMFQITKNISIERPVFNRETGKFFLFGALDYDQAVTNSVGNTKGFVAIFNPKSVMVEKVWVFKGPRSTHVNTVLPLPGSKKIWVGGFTNSGDTHDPVDGAQPFVEPVAME